MASDLNTPWEVKPAPAAVAARPRRGRGWLSWALAVLVLAGLAAGGWFGWKAWFGGDSGAERFTTTPVVRGDIEDTVTATGTLQPRDFVDVGTQVSGQLKKLHVEIGNTVKQGQLLAEIDPTVYESRVDADRAQLKNQEAQLNDKRSQLALAQQQLQRQQNLMKEEATTSEQLQQAEASVRSITAQIEALRAQKEQTDSSLRGNEANLSYTKVYAPMPGTVASMPAKQGQTLNANQQAPVILRVADLSIMTVQAQVSEADVPKLRVGMDVYFTTLGGDGKRWYGKLRQVNPTPTIVNNVVLYDALFDVPNPGQELMTQMTAQVFFVAAYAKDAVYVPIAALRPVGRGGARRGEAKGEAEGQGGGERRKRGEGFKKGEGFKRGGEESEKGADAKADPRRVDTKGDAKAGAKGEGRPRPADIAATDPRSQFANGRAMVRVVKEDGQVEQREVRVGLTTRVSAQILSGLEPGENVALGARGAAAAKGPEKGPGAPKFTPRL
jgi:macrolide-specific efflux system membrane fusion protein